jgi:hypothetical protein
MFSRLSRKLVEIKKAEEVQNENDFTFGKKPSFFGGSIGCGERRRKKVLIVICGKQENC